MPFVHSEGRKSNIDMMLAVNQREENGDLHCMEHARAHGNSKCKCSRFVCPSNKGEKTQELEPFGHLVSAVAVVKYESRA